MKLDFSGQRAVVTGGTRGIGRRIAEDLSRSERRLSPRVEIRTASPRSTAPRQTPDDIRAVTSAIARRPSVLPTNWDVRSASRAREHAGSTASILSPNVARRIGRSQSRQSRGALLPIRTAAPCDDTCTLRADCAHRSGLRPRQPAEADRVPVTKFGLRGLTVATSNELAADNVLVNTVFARVCHDGTEASILSTAEQEDLTRADPARRFATPRDISRVVVFLCSSLNSYWSDKRDRRRRLRQCLIFSWCGRRAVNIRCVWAGC